MDTTDSLTESYKLNTGHPPYLTECGAMAQWLAQVGKIASSIPGRGIPRNNLGW